jgi:hypothetical protein
MSLHEANAVCNGETLLEAIGERGRRALEEHAADPVYPVLVDLWEEEVAAALTYGPTASSWENADVEVEGGSKPFEIDYGPDPNRNPAPPEPEPEPEDDQPRDLRDEPDLVAAIRRDLRTAGLVGNSDAGLLVYLAYSSRKLAKPISTIIKGPSSSGKDEVQRRPADLMSPEDVIDAMDITPQALYYQEPGWLKNKIVLGGERSHQDDPFQRDRTKAIRHMLSHGYITKRTVEQGLKGKDIRQDGPISYSETTTRDSIFDEDANRCLQVETDASPELTREVKRARGLAYKPGQDSAGADAQKVILRHWSFQADLTWVDVRIPYCDVLADLTPDEPVQVRRAFGQVLVLIEAIAFVHQFHRGRNEWNQLEATLEDYALARRLVLGPLLASIGLSRQNEEHAKRLKKLPNRQFTTVEAGKVMGAKSRKVTLDWLKQLAGLGLVECVRRGTSHKPATWRKTGKRPEDLLLPDVEAVRKAMGGAAR